MLLQVRNLRCGYGSLEVVHGISLHVCAGEIVGLLGANGAGKSSLLKPSSACSRPGGAEIRMDGRPARRPARLAQRQQLDGARARRPQDLRRHDRAREPAHRRLPQPRPRPGHRGHPGPVSPPRERARQLGGTLSGGEQQMLALGRALVVRPRILLLDRPLLVATTYCCLRLSSPPAPPAARHARREGQQMRIAATDRRRRGLAPVARR